MDVKKAKELAEIIKSKNFADMEGAGMPEFRNYEENMQLAKEILSALDEPVTKTGVGLFKMGEEWHGCN